MLRYINFHYHIQIIDNGYVLEFDYPNKLGQRYFSKLDALLKFMSKIEAGRIKKTTKEINNGKERQGKT